MLLLLAGPILPENEGDVAVDLYEGRGLHRNFVSGMTSPHPYPELPVVLRRSVS